MGAANLWKIVATLIVVYAVVFGCTALLDWHLHDTTVEVEDKKVIIEGEEARDYEPEEKEEVWPRQE